MLAQVLNRDFTLGTVAATENAGMRRALSSSTSARIRSLPSAS